MPPCTCDQHGKFCPVHPTCACGGERHAHADCIGRCDGSHVRCHGCEQYRAATLRRFDELGDADIEQMDVDAVRDAYRRLRAHHVEETSALWHRLSGSAAGS